MKSVIKILSASSVIIGLQACSVATSTLSLGLDLKAGQTFHMKINTQEVSHITAIGEESTDSSIAKWDLTFQVETVEENAITFLVSFDTFDYVRDGIEKIFKPSDFNNLDGQSFKISLDRAGNFISLTGYDEVKKNFLSKIDMHARAIEIMSKGDPNFQNRLAKSDETTTKIVAVMADKIAKIGEFAFDSSAGEERIKAILQWIFVANISEPASEGKKWTGSKASILSFSEAQPTTIELSLSEIVKGMGQVSVAASSHQPAKQAIYGDLLAQASLGIGMSISGADGETSGDITLDLKSGWPQDGNFKMTSKGMVTFELSSENDSQSTQKLQPAPYVDEFDISFKRHE